MQFREDKHSNQKKGVKNVDTLDRGRTLVMNFMTGGAKGY
jgi:hypothetical protein